MLSHFNSQESSFILKWLTQAEPEQKIAEFIENKRIHMHSNEWLSKCLTRAGKNWKTTVFKDVTREARNEQILGKHDE